MYLMIEIRNVVVVLWCLVFFIFYILKLFPLYSTHSVLLVGLIVVVPQILCTWDHKYYAPGILLLAYKWMVRSDHKWSVICSHVLTVLVDVYVDILVHMH